VEDNRFLAETQASLDRMKQALREAPAEDGPGRDPAPDSAAGGETR
jgi:hypothetical protein